MTPPPEQHFPTFLSWRALAATGPEHAEAAWRQQVAIARQTPGWETAIVSMAGGALWREQESPPGEGPLAGVPFGLKDLFAVAGLPTTASSVFLAEVLAPPTHDAAIVKALKGAGARLALKTHLNEFAYGLDGVNAHFGTVPNPRDPRHLAGGSSSGSAWAVATGLVPVAIGTDTGGSIRVPAAFCGLYGFRLVPAHAWSREGCFPLSRRFDTAGWLTHHRGDMEAMLAAVPVAPPVPLKTLPEGLNLCAARDGVAPKILTALEATVAPWTRRAKKSETARWNALNEPLVEAFNILQSTDAHSVHKPWLHPRRALYDPATWARLARAEHWTPTQLERAETVAGDWTGELARWIEEFGYIVLPTAPDEAPRIRDGMDGPSRESILAFTVPASLAGYPVLSLPAHVNGSGPCWTAAQVILPADLGRAIPLARAILAASASGGGRGGVSR